MASRPRSRARSRPIPRVVASHPRVSTAAAAFPPGEVALAEDPHAHIVCRACGRIQPMELTELDRHLLTRLADGRPEGWTVDGIAFSMTGACRRCREGPHP
jgi:hypothetical protein